MDVHDLMLISKPNTKQVHLLAILSDLDMPKSKHLLIIWERFCQIGNRFHQMASIMERFLMVVKIMGKSGNGWWLLLKYT